MLGQFGDPFCECLSKSGPSPAPNKVPYFESPGRYQGIDVSAIVVSARFDRRMRPIGEDAAKGTCGCGSKIRYPKWNPGKAGSEGSPVKSLSFKSSTCNSQQTIRPLLVSFCPTAANTIRQLLHSRKARFARRSAQTKGGSIIYVPYFNSLHLSMVFRGLLSKSERA